MRPLRGKRRRLLLEISHRLLDDGNSSMFVLLTHSLADHVPNAVSCTHIDLCLPRLLSQALLELLDDGILLLLGLLLHVQFQLFLADLSLCPPPLHSYFHQVVGSALCGLLRTGMIRWHWRRCLHRVDHLH